MQLFRISLAALIITFSCLKRAALRSNCFRRTIATMAEFKLRRGVDVEQQLLPNGETQVFGFAIKNHLKSKFFVV